MEEAQPVYIVNPLLNAHYECADVELAYTAIVELGWDTASIRLGSPTGRFVALYDQGEWADHVILSVLNANLDFVTPSSASTPFPPAFGVIAGDSSEFEEYPPDIDELLAETGDCYGPHTRAGSHTEAPMFERQFIPDRPIFVLLPDGSYSDELPSVWAAKQVAQSRHYPHGVVDIRYDAPDGDFAALRLNGRWVSEDVVELLNLRRKWRAEYNGRPWARLFTNLQIIATGVLFASVLANIPAIAMWGTLRLLGVKTPYSRMLLVSVVLNRRILLRSLLTTSKYVV